MSDISSCSDEVSWKQGTTILLSGLLLIASAVLAGRIVYCFIPHFFDCSLFWHWTAAIVVGILMLFALGNFCHYSPETSGSSWNHIAMVYNDSNMLNIDRPNALIGGLVAGTGIGLVLIGWFLPGLGVVVLVVHFFFTVPFSSVVSQRFD